MRLIDYMEAGGHDDKVINELIEAEDPGYHERFFPEGSESARDVKDESGASPAVDGPAADSDPAV